MTIKNGARIHIFVYGLVQGVFFRAHTERFARSLGLTGWVRNRENGSVEIVAEGEREQLKRLLAWCKKGPSAARVEKVESTWENYEGEFGKFEIRYL